ncbi:unnamed protein product [Pleuronectes platessa]|uniref:DEAD/DEAH-box helicase domain-containing protein n=1 Tax=Pleuronectes platessa TaxID=8262 RepID=A0A9N7TMI1_PLEPL|nr:unnamed protein product [Pleuronectes platessa]
MPAAGELRCVDAAIESVLGDIDSAFILKEEQRNAIKALVDRKDVFAVLPTGFGKSLIYQLAPMVAKKMGHGNNAAMPPALSDAIEAHCQQSAPGQGGVAPRVAQTFVFFSVCGPRDKKFGHPCVRAWLREPQLPSATPQWELAQQQHPSTLLSQRLEVSRGPLLMRPLKCLTGSSNELTLAGLQRLASSPSRG